MKIAFFLMSVVFTAVLQGTVLNNFRFFWVRPDLLLGMIVIASLSLRIRWALLSAFLAGFLKDAMGVYPFGINTLLFPAWAFLIIKLKRQISVEDSPWIPLAIACALSVANNIVIRALLFSMGGLAIPAGIFVRTVFIESVYTGLAFPFLSRAVRPIILFSASAYKK